jgi:uncharacterized protein (DUF2384 family)
MTLTTEERLADIDHRVDELKQGLVEAVESLQRAPEVDDAWGERWLEVSKRMRGLRAGLDPADFSKAQVVIIWDALLEIGELLDRKRACEDLNVLDQLLVRLERIRHVVRDVLDERVNGIAAGDMSMVLGEVERWLPDIPDRVIANLLDVNPRTLYRWRAQSDKAPGRTLRVFARLVAILRHNWDEEGIVAWFERPRRELGDRRPAALLSDPSAELQLVSAARSGRSQYAA